MAPRPPVALPPVRGRIVRRLDALVCSLDEGDATLIVPPTLSAESIAKLEAHLALVLDMLRSRSGLSRRVPAPTPGQADGPT